MTMWIGLNDQHQVGVYRWSDTTPLTDDSIWAVGQPRFRSVCVTINTGVSSEVPSVSGELCVRTNVGLCQKYIGEFYFDGICKVIAGR